MDRLVGRGRLVCRGRLVIRSRSRLIRSGSRLVSGRSWFVGLLFRVDRLSLILDISNIALRSSTVGDNLHSTVRKVDSVFSSSVVILPFFLLGKHRSIMRVIH